jgi:hypothetical protein
MIRELGEIETHKGPPFCGTVSETLADIESRETTEVVILAARHRELTITAIPSEHRTIKDCIRVIKHKGLS